MKRRYEVRCCCEPGKLLGWLEIDAEESARHVNVFAQADVLRGEEPPTHYGLPFAMFQSLGILRKPAYRAIKADGVPIEVLRQIPGFTENFLASFDDSFLTSGLPALR